MPRRMGLRRQQVPRVAQELRKRREVLVGKILGVLIDRGQILGPPEYPSRLVARIRVGRRAEYERIVAHQISRNVGGYVDSGCGGGVHGKFSPRNPDAEDA